MSENKLQRNNNVKAIEGDKGDQKTVNLPTSSRNVIIAGLLFVALFFGGIGVWAATANLEGAVIAQGDIIVETYRQQVQHRDGGIVKDIKVREGYQVEKGDVLITLDGEEVRAQRDMYRARMDSFLARQARLMAEIQNADSIEWPLALLERSHLPDATESMESEEQIFKSRMEAKNSRIELLRAQINTQNSLIHGRERQLQSIEDTISSLEEEIQAKDPLLEGGFIDITEILELQRTLNSNRANKEELTTEIDQAEERIKELELEITDLEKSYAQEAASELGDVRQEIVDLREQMRPAEDAARRLNVTAPKAGVVVNLEVRTEGGVIQGGEPLMEIVPRDTGLIVSAKVDPDKIDDVRKGQDASVMLSAFPRRYTPKVKGVVTYVAADRTEPEQRDEPPYYLTYVQLDQQSLKDAIDDPGKLTPGMPAEVYIQTEAQTVMSYVLSPIIDSMDRAFREN
ncbi:type I secretion membrane fusion protein, HlyD family [Desulfonatronospira thiodismutans ASO3-1]|uniref:Type I secretion membrane fusion protein, HlyD family n=1 Tax=Desulfonatronospira thiodismutans ASO3-1 TaxID=555779 RepID=D6SNB8_9BACT|nr:HlyD family type I secretion periplasmic adaptor subunit [Desulfonatronospira thiodismutans]EFI34244.1 type I secretion membrane fusion protein, HlyD family [Desulfonatronospira thiodismutans ASO3-1]